MNSENEQKKGMKILVISDEKSPKLWESCSREWFADIDLIISCGDLKSEYLSYVVTMAKCPLMYVYGNHDAYYDVRPPEGCDCIDGKIIKYKGLRILGLGGSMKYNGGPYQYSEREMQGRIRRLKYKLWKHKGFDILVTHAPAYGIQDGDDLAHTGFVAFLDLIEKYKPKLFLHGHMHMNYGHMQSRVVNYNSTMIVNGFGMHIIELSADDMADT